MKKLLLIFLLLASIAYGADLVHLSGVATSGVNAPTCTAKAVYDAGSPSDFFEANGAASLTASGVTITDNGTDLTLSGLASTANVTVGQYVFLTNAIGTTFEGLNLIASKTADTVTCSDTNLQNDVTNLGGPDTVDFVIGGIRTVSTTTNLQDMFIDAGSFISNNAISNNLDILYNLSTITIDTTIDIDNISGSTTTRVRTIGTNSSFVDDGTQVTISTTTDLTSAGFGLFSIATSDFVYYKNIDFNGGGKDASRALYCVYSNTSNTTNHVFENCIFRGAESHGLNADSVSNTYWETIDCEATLNGGSGIRFDGEHITAIGCKSHLNDLHGIELVAFWCSAINNICFDNGQNGAGAGSGIVADNGGDNCKVIGNTCTGNDGDGIKLENNAVNTLVYNNACNDNTGIQFNLSGNFNLQLRYFSHNMASIAGAGTALYSEGADNTFAAVGNGNNIASIQNTATVFVDTVGFVPKTGSDLIDNAVQWGGTSTLDIGAVQQTAGGGDFPDKSVVLAPNTTDGETGTLTLPSATNVLTGTGTYGVSGTGSTPTLTLPLESDVLTGSGLYGVDGDGSTPSFSPDFPAVANVFDDTVDDVPGTLTLPTANNVYTGNGVYGVGGNGSTPTLTLADQINVLLGSGLYGVGGNGSTPSLTSPATSNVLTREGTYGAAGTGSTPVYAPALKENVELAVKYGANGTEFTGEFVGSGDFPTQANTRVGDTTNGLPGLYEPALELNVEKLIQYGANGTEFTGELEGGGLFGNNYRARYK